ncbi:uncharacterized protein LOC131226255 isoform X1 [Magnolia sinica]|uniref:uncharacterized protein LOC131226255 isoform X1 n=1 Tax=Magnolia sinica TaxID=86752 RepID=UPI002657EDC2|nr:uncharacterized protein LOC131226255 isoform X1 [Magnolia sinica]
MSHSHYQEEEEEEEEEEEHFFESLDRILSSSSPSSSSSETDQVGVGGRRRRRRRGPPPFADYVQSLPSSSPPNQIPDMAVYDVWIAEPAPVEERRRRLLQQLGLSNDRTLARLKSMAVIEDDDGGGGGGDAQVPSSSGSSRTVEIKRSASCNDQLQLNQGCTSANSPIPRSRSDSGPATISASNSSNCSNNHLDTSFPPIHSIQSIRLFQSDDPVTVCPVHSDSNNTPYTFLHSKHGTNDTNSLLVANAASPNKPPIGKSSRRADPTHPASSHVVTANDDDPDSIGRDRLCTIKNLDNGKEFVVNEFGEDGMWNKLREVGTGRQLTREEFEMSVGHSPIVQELMRRQNFEESLGSGKKDDLDSSGKSGGSKSKKKGGGWLKSIKHVASTMTGHRERRSSDERDTSSEKGGRRSSSATDDSQDVSSHTSERTKVRNYGKPYKELTALYMSQEVRAHNGSIWSIKFSSDGRYLASAGEDRVIHIWQVVESERKGDLLTEKFEDGNSIPFFGGNGSPEPTLVSSNTESHLEKKRRSKVSYNRKSLHLDHVVVPESVFALSEKPICSFKGHLADVLDLSWSKSQHLLSSSMDKTVRLWHMSSNSCLKTFSHSDYVTCIQFNPVDDRYFISGSLDAKVRIWSILDRKVVDWNELNEMVTAACYTPDGQGAFVGSHKGSCRLYNTSDNKLHQESQIDLQNKKKRSGVKKITSFQFAPGSSSEVLITSADSRIRVVDGVDLIHKFKGFRNTSSQISASLTANGKYVVCASEDSQVYVWGYDGDSRPSRSKGVTVTQSYEHFHCRDVTVAIPWPGVAMGMAMQETCCSEQSTEASTTNRPVRVEGANRQEGSPSASGCGDSPLHAVPNSNGNYFSDRTSATWPEEKLVLSTERRSSQSSGDFFSSRSAWGMVIVTAGLGGEIKIFQNFGLPVRI